MRMDSMWPNRPLARVLLLSCICALPLQAQRPGQIDPLTSTRADPQCWNSSSALLIKMRSPKIADTVPNFWDLMAFLNTSDNSKHTELFWDLAQVFWDIYMDCVLSRTHGLGRRQLKWPKGQLTSMNTFIPDKSYRINSSAVNFNSLRRRGSVFVFGARNRLSIIDHIKTLIRSYNTHRQ